MWGTLWSATLLQYRYLYWPGRLAMCAGAICPHVPVRRRTTFATLQCARLENLTSQKSHKKQISINLNLLSRLLFPLQ